MYEIGDERVVRLTSMIDKGLTKEQLIELEKVPVDKITVEHVRMILDAIRLKTSTRKCFYCSMMNDGGEGRHVFVL
jgi:hypothetical protein